MLQLNGKRINGNRKIPFLTHPRVPANFEKKRFRPFFSVNFSNVFNVNASWQDNVRRGRGGGEEMKEELKKETSQINEEIWLEF